MTTETILARVNAILNAADSQLATSALKNLSVDLTDQLRAEYAAKRGDGNAVKTISAMLKSKDLDTRPALQYPWIDSEGRQCMTDGFRAYRLKEHLPLPERPADVGSGIDLDKVFKPTSNYAAMLLPTVQELKAFIAVERAAQTGPKRERKPPVWDFGDGKPAVNAQYLLDLITVLPDAELYFNPSDTLAILYARSERGDAVLLPIRRNRQAVDSKQAEARRAARDAARMEFNQLLDEYRAKIDRDITYAIDPEAFARLADAYSASHAA